MKARLTITYVCLSVALPHTVDRLQAQAAPKPATFRTSVQMVLLPVTVTDHYGKTINSLRARDFTVLDDQRPQQIISFGSEDAPCSVGLVLDISGSMRNLLGTVKGVAHTFLATANPEDELSLLTVSTQPEAIPGFTSDIPSMEQDIQFTRAGGMTALIDTIYLGLNRMRHARRPRRALLVVSDGIENHSRYSKAELIRVALEADVQVYTIVIDNPSVAGDSTLMRSSMVRKPWDQGPGRQGRELLEELSNKTGGLHFAVRKESEAKAAAAKIGAALRNQYVIGYQPATVGGTGKWRKLRVRLNVPNLHVYTRSGYYSE
jgi:Ca-activated chloride channel homolog